jgi:predicted  nucleic acid-binding Zn-ribbon protein
VEYDAIRSQIAHDEAAIVKLEDEALELMSQAEAQETELKASEAEIARLGSEVQALAVEVEQKAEPMKAQLAELEQSITAAENVIPADTRDQYRRVVSRMGADGMAAVEHGACSGCYLSPTAQTMNDLINGDVLVFCKSCGRILYLAEEEHANLRRS